MQILGKVGHTMKYKILTIVEIVFFSLEIIALVLLFISSYNDKYDKLALGMVILLFLPSFVSECFIFSFIRCLFSIKKTIEIVVSIVGIVVSSFGFLCLIGELFSKSHDLFWLISWMLILVAIICRIIVLACRKKANNN